jgi:nucleoside-diphosphate-sugar epimerase
MTLWVTGSSGFIGSHLCKRFPKRNMLRIPHETLKSIPKIKELAESHPPTAIYHFAAYGNMAHQQDVFQMMESNVIYLFNLLWATKDIDYKTFINCSTSSVYGDKKHAMHETNSLDGTDPYSITKQIGELLVRAFVNKYDKPIVNIRPFSVYGEGEADYRLFQRSCGV